MINLKNGTVDTLLRSDCLCNYYQDSYVVVKTKDEGVKKKDDQKSQYDFDLLYLESTLNSNE